MKPLMRAIVAAAAAATLAGCNTLSQIPDVDLAKPPEELVYPQQRAVPNPVPTGSLYSPASYRPGFEDHRARLVGDVITIQITENLSASQSAKTDVSRQSSLSAGVSAFPFLGAGTLADLNAGAKSANSMSGDGKTEASNTFRGSITAVVTDVLPNGHLVVIGEKQIGVNQAVDVLQFSGTVDPRAIRPGNTVLSTQVANVRVLSRGRGAPADAQTFGWLARFFLTLLPF
ncbi:flagellar basal body L-ring protein FlgH [Tepidimonas taiwanensis]|uniref:Flagellar L-ring protein n=1 Tax=Tepidimonas taiwanensis TaxID=307486 RepID=A0A554XCE8_9BURK|nr:flagellar basal body L-ring protein FlgH [Tepidimonas taiwanensis]MCX7693286.1 flagellar basal body L-ring protein FlgH [Tepidimonas taiwanensis]MDM7464215.1 flagellar basal body L-ring protein FlgH [Tepidimonas taiwanensis]TSE33517.1 Flagellar L-ring protein [Tepidimonas taiwanensis]UBQ05781.1 flagellar basal body L-ring protein FlgH [Tepidimonas taiwanensis]